MSGKRNSGKEALSVFPTILCVPLKAIGYESDLVLSCVSYSLALQQLLFILDPAPTFPL